jgi:hypothetical protein
MGQAGWTYLIALLAADEQANTLSVGHTFPVFEAMLPERVREAD